LRIAQILINLIGNAIKFTEEGQVTLTTWVDGEHLNFLVKDSGIGMPQETLDQLFQYFQQADQSISRRFGGSGLGLYISQNLSEMMGGYIDVSSQKGGGASFTLVLPYRPTTISVQQYGKRTTDNSVMDKALRGEVLIAEDIRELQLLERRMLEKLGVTVTVANNGKEAVDLVHENQFDLILMDMQMPVMDGLDATRLLRKQGISTPIIALTANVMQKHRDAFNEAGCDGFLSKPIDKQEMGRVLERHLSGEKKRSQASLATAEEVVDDELMAIFNESTTQRKAALIQALSDKDWQQVREIAHATKGSAASFGYPELSSMAESVQLAIIEERLDEVPALAMDLVIEMGKALS